MKKILFVLVLITIFFFIGQNFFNINQTIVKNEKLIGYQREGNIVIDIEKNLMWQDNYLKKNIKKNWENAKKYCKNLSFEGYNDWRLPTIDELQMIVDYSRSNPAIFKIFENVAFQENYEREDSRGYWSSSEYVSYVETAWSVDFMYGYTSRYSSKYNEHFVRCVRRCSK